MPLKRFEELRSYLHFNDNNKMKDRDDPDQDRAFKLRPALDRFNLSFLRALSATEHQSIDEHMIKFKGHNIMRQYVKGKPIKWGLKMWSRCASKTSYLHEFDLNTGKKKKHTERGLGEGVVLQLTEKIKGLGCQLFIDNYFNTPTLQWNLLQGKVYCTGTVRLNRKNMPKPPKAVVPSDKDTKKGDMNCFATDDENFVMWMDSRGVHMLSNFLSAQPLYKVSLKQKGSSTKDIISCPNIRKQYNEHNYG